MSYIPYEVYKTLVRGAKASKYKGLGIDYRRKLALFHCSEHGGRADLPGRDGEIVHRTSQEIPQQL